jgi:hypothetical protein
MCTALVAKNQHPLTLYRFYKVQIPFIDIVKSSSSETRDRFTHAEYLKAITTYQRVKPTKFSHLKQASAIWN